MAVLCYGFWVLLNGKITWEIMLLGLGVAALAMLFLCACCDWSLKKEWKLYRCVPQLIAYAGVVIWEIIKANLAVCHLILTRREVVDPVIVKVHTNLKTETARVILANSITLTPGTITVSLTDRELLVHCLDKSLAEGMEDSEFVRLLEALEGEAE